MSWLGITLTIIVVAYFVGKFAFRRLVRSLHERVKNDPEYQAEMARLHESYEREKTVMEVAPWIGTTGLGEEIERELPKYLRREFGELLLDDDSLKASDLVYLGKFSEEGCDVHYWRIPTRDEETSVAYVHVGSDGSVSTGWGDRDPPLAAI